MKNIILGYFTQVFWNLLRKYEVYFLAYAYKSSLFIFHMGKKNGSQEFKSNQRNVCNITLRAGIMHVWGPQYDPTPYAPSSASTSVADSKGPSTLSPHSIILPVQTLNCPVQLLEYDLEWLPDPLEYCLGGALKIKIRKYFCRIT